MKNISVIVPIFRVEEYLEECINSILQQTYEDFELILVNDGSDDRCGEICEEYALNDTRIIYIKKINGGLVSARKEGLKHASGSWVTFVDGDDWIEKDHLLHLVKSCDEGVDLVITSFKRDFLKKTVEIKNNMPTGTYEKDKLIELKKRCIFNGSFFQHGISTYVWNKLFKRDKLLPILNCIDNKIVMGEDSCITYPYIFSASKVVLKDTPTYRYRQRQNSIIKKPLKFTDELEKLNYLFKHLKKELSIHAEQYNISSQLKNYYFSLITTRSGGSFDITDEDFNIFCKEDHKNIAIVSSGTFGQQLFSKLYKKGINIIWIDDDYEESQSFDMKVYPFEKLLSTKYEKIFIASLNPEFISTIISKINSLGINDEFIYFISERSLSIMDVISQKSKGSYESFE